MMLPKSILLLFHIVIILFSPLVADEYDTLNITALLDTEKKTISGNIVIPIPDGFDDSIFVIQLPANRIMSILENGNSIGGSKKPMSSGRTRIDSILIDGAKANVTIDDFPSYYKIDLPKSSGKINIYFATQTSEYGTRLISTFNEYFLSDWFPGPALYFDNEWKPCEHITFAEPGSNFYRYHINLTVPRELTVSSPAIEVSFDTDNNQKTYELEFGPAVDFALALSANYLVDSTSMGTTNIKFYYRDYETELMKSVKNVTEFAFKYLEDNVGPYLYPELNITMINASRPVGLEYPGLVALFSPRGGALISNYYEYMTVREIARQWFYAMIASNQPEEPWLNKSIAEFFALEIANEYYGADAGLIDWGGFKVAFDDDIRLNARVGDGKYAINSPADKFAREIEFSSTIYNRGALVIQTIDNLLGDSLSNNFWRRYYNDNLFQVTSGKAFFNLLNEIGGEDIKGIAEYLLNRTESIDYSVSGISYDQIDSVTYRSQFTFGRTGSLSIPVEYQIILYNDDTLSYSWDSEEYSIIITHDLEMPVREVIIDSKHIFAVDHNLLNNSAIISGDNRPAWRLSSGIMFLIESLLSLAGGW